MFYSKYSGFPHLKRYFFSREQMLSCRTNDVVGIGVWGRELLRGPMEIQTIRNISNSVAMKKATR